MFLRYLSHATKTTRLQHFSDFSAGGVYNEGVEQFLGFRVAGQRDEF